MNLSVVIPAYKEAENLKVIIPQIQETLKDIEYEINIIDTIEGMDDTEIVCHKNSVNYFHREGGNLYGDAIRTGFKVSSKDHLLIMDADCSHSPSDLPKMLNKADMYDLTIGSRYVTNGKTDNPWILVFMSWVVNTCFRIALGLNVKDISNSFRIYKTEDIKALQLDCNNFDIVEEIIIKLSVFHKDYRIREVPITFNKRMYGESKRDLVKFVFSYLKTLVKLFNIKRKTKRNMENEKHCIQKGT